MDNLASGLSVLRGFGSDLALGLAMGFVAYLLYSKGKPAYWLLWIFWCLTLAFNMDHVQINDANVNYRHWPFMVSGHFLSQCVFSRSNLYHGGWILLGSFGLALILTWKRKNPAARGWWVWGVVPFCLFLFVVPLSSLAPNWVQANPVEENLRRLIYGSAGPPERQNLKAQDIAKFFTSDLTGTPLFAFPSERQNIVLIILENLSFDAAFSGQMPHLQRLARRHLFYQNFFSLQRQSNRGFYALMSGNYPNFISLEAKADILLAGQTLPTALPAALAAQGYNTLFMEANELGFFQRESFCKAVGFQKSLGKAQYPESPEQKGWGVADDILFKHALEQIRRLRQAGAPWFVTIFTGGAHYPYSVPGLSSPTWAQAVTAMDASLNIFLTELSKQGVLQNTLVLITSDEACFPSGRGLQRALAGNHAPLLVMTPQASRPMTLDGVFTQRDLFLSIGDYLGLKIPEAQGRSIFRTYAADPDILFGNVYASHRYAYLSTGRLYDYSLLANQWLCYRLSRKHLFSPSVRMLPDPADIALLESVFLLNEQTFDRLQKQIIFRQTDITYAGEQQLLGGHKISCQAGDRLFWKAVIEATEPIEMQIRLTTYRIPVTSNNRRHLLLKSIACANDKPCIFQHQYLAEDDIDTLTTHISIRPSGSAPYKVKELLLKKIKNDDSENGGNI